MTAYPPMSKYSTPLEFSNLKNSLKSGGTCIVSICNLPHQFRGLQPVLWGCPMPEFYLVRLLLQRTNSNRVSVNPVLLNERRHFPYLIRAQPPILLVIHFHIPLRPLRTCY